MRAFQLLAVGEPPRIVEIPVPVPGPGQILVRVTAASICHTDLAVAAFDDQTLTAWGIDLPMTLGHETAGVVEVAGAGVTDVAVGDPVLVNSAWGCGTCDRCARGAENLCLRVKEAGVKSPGIAGQGGMAEFILVDSIRHLHPLGDVDAVKAAPLADAGVTSFRAIEVSRAKLDASSTVVVIGVGGLGHLAVQIINTTSPARILAVDRGSDRADLARRSGADLFLESDDFTADQIRAETGGRGADVVIDFVGSDSTARLAVQTVVTGGDITLVGVGGGSLAASVTSLPPEVTVRTIYWATRTGMSAVLDLARRGLVRPAIQTYPLDAAPVAFADVETGRVLGRAVLVP
jgi:propanol-preferring alcohol dehydrogenase